MNYTAEIKKHINENDYLAQYGKGIKLVRVEFVKEIKNSDAIAEMEVTTSFKAKKYENNIAKWRMVLYNDGCHVFFFDGESYEA